MVSGGLGDLGVWVVSGCFGWFRVVSGGFGALLGGFGAGFGAGFGSIEWFLRPPEPIRNHPEPPGNINFSIIF